MGAYEAAVAAKSEHHSTVRGHRKQAAVPHADDDQGEENNRAVLAKDVNEDLQNGLAIGGIQCIVEVLDGEEEG